MCLQCVYSSSICNTLTHTHAHACGCVWMCCRLCGQRSIGKIMLMIKCAKCCLPACRRYRYTKRYTIQYATALFVVVSATCRDRRRRRGAKSRTVTRIDRCRSRKRARRRPKVFGRVGGGVDSGWFMLERISKS